MPIGIADEHGALAAQGWLGLHVPEDHGGSGYTLGELVVVLEELGRAACPDRSCPPCSRPWAASSSSTSTRATCSASA